MKDYTRDHCVRGLHMYSIIWEVTVGEVCDWEIGIRMASCGS